MRVVISSPAVWAAILSVLSGLAAAGLAAESPPGRDGLIDTVAQPWQIMQREEVNSPALLAARKELLKAVAQLPRSRRPAAATAIMDTSAADNVNAAALWLFGQDPLGIDDIRVILVNNAY